MKKSYSSKSCSITIWSKSFGLLAALNLFWLAWANAESFKKEWGNLCNEVQGVGSGRAGAGRFPGRWPLTNPAKHLSTGKAHDSSCKYRYQPAKRIKLW